MKRFISLILILALAMMPASTAFADTIKLPSSLKTIDKEAFLDNSSIEEVVVPYGAETIGERAFAGSELNRIYIPDTVISIADDAFEDVVNLTIYSSSGSHAQEYAEEHEYLWQDARNTYQQDQFNEAQDIYNDLEEGDISLDQLTWTGFDTSGEEHSEDFLAFAEEYNAAQAEIAALAEEYELQLDLLSGELSSLDGMMEESTMEYSDDGISYSGNGISYNLNTAGLEGLGPDMEVISTQTTESGNGILIEVLSGGNTYFIESDNNSFKIIGSETTVAATSADGYLVASFEVEPYLSSSSGSNSAFQAVIDKINTYIEPLDKLELALISAKESAEKLKSQAEEQFNKLVNKNTDGFTLKEIEAHLKEVSNAAGRITFIIKALKAIEKALKALAVINPVASINSIKENWNNWQAVDVIEKHGHPLPEESGEDEKLEIIAMLDRLIKSAKISYFIGSLIDMVDLVDDITTVLGMVVSLTGVGAVPAAIAKSAIFVGLKATKAALVRIIASIVIEAAGDETYAKIEKLDRKLHGGVSGVVTDSLSGEPIRNVAVQMDGMTCYTDAEGKFWISISEGTHTIVFSKSKYVDEERTVTMTGGAKDEYFDIQLDPKSALEGTVRDAETMNPIAGATVDFGWYSTTTDENGHYHFDLEPATEILMVTMEGYADYEIEATCERFKTNTYDILLEPWANPTGIITGIVRDGETLEPIAGATVEYGMYFNYVSTTTDEEGRYTLEVEEGSSLLVIEKDGYPIYETFDVNGEVNMTKVHDVYMYCLYNIEVTWNESPRIYFGSDVRFDNNGESAWPQQGENSVVHTIDIDRSKDYTIYVDYGVWTEAWNKPQGNVYKDLAAIVNIYKNNTKIATYTAPSGDGESLVWAVCSINKGKLNGLNILIESDLLY